MESNLVRELIAHYLGAVSRQQIDKRMETATPRIVEAMLKKGMVPEQVPVSVVVRDALFRLWRSVIPSGDVSDLIRDRQESKVVPLAMMAIGGNLGVSQIVSATREALLEVTF